MNWVLVNEKEKKSNQGCRSFQFKQTGRKSWRKLTVAPKKKKIIVAKRKIEHTIKFTWFFCRGSLSDALWVIWLFCWWICYYGKSSWVSGDRGKVIKVGCIQREFCRMEQKVADKLQGSLFDEREAREYMRSWFVLELHILFLIKVKYENYDAFSSQNDSILPCMQQSTYTV